MQHSKNDEPRHPSDPRIDLLSDYRYWKVILWNCWHEERELYYLLHGIRCGGAELALTQNSFRLMPGEWTDSEWNGDIKQRLNPFRDKLVNIFKLSRVGQITNEKLPKGIFEDTVEQEVMFG